MDRAEYRHKTYVLKRQYETEEQEREHFDAMFADYLAKMDEQLGHVYRWRDEDELLENVDALPH